MATILQIDYCLDGRDAKCQLSDASVVTFHFAAVPVDLQAACDAAETNYIKSQPVITIVTGNGTVVTQ